MRPFEDETSLVSSENFGVKFLEIFKRHEYDQF